MINTSGLSPLLQAAVGGSKSIAGQYITKTEQGFMYDSGQQKIPVQDPDNILQVDSEGFVVDNDYIIEETENGLIIKGINKGESAPGMGDSPSPEDQTMPMGGVGGPMEMHSPVKNYKKGYYGIK
jgi:hypothetical protein